MPKFVTTVDNTKKHLTKKQIEQRRNAENSMKRDKIKIEVPNSIKKNLNAYKYWKNIIKSLKNIELLDNLDGETLGVYCSAMAIRDDLIENYNISQSERTLSTLQSQERLILTYANKLGLTPESRARLAKNKAESIIEDKNSDLYGSA